MASVFRWSDAQLKAFTLDCQGGYTAETIAQAVGVTARTVEGWRRRPAWRKRRQVETDAMIARMHAAWDAHTRQYIAETVAETFRR